MPTREMRVVPKKSPDDLFGDVNARERVQRIAVRAWDQVLAEPQNVERRHNCNKAPDCPTDCLTCGAFLHTPAMSSPFLFATHECPICMDNADDATVDGVHPAACFACGQYICGQCKRQVEANDAKCPTCRAPFDVSDEECVARLLQLLKRAPGRHTPWAQHNLGVMYTTGRGAPQDHNQGVKLIRAAAEYGISHAQHCLGIAYNSGEGVPEDHALAGWWTKLAADQKHADAQYTLGLMYASGRGVPHDYVKAIEWMQLSAGQGNASAIAGLGSYLRHVFPPGTKVTLVGLTSAAHNGKRGVAAEGNAALGRVAVLVDGDPQPKSFLFKNLFKNT